jgi:glyoxylase-like metal-dependent hydrolase (beta-lactamase superfamily II)
VNQPTVTCHILDTGYCLAHESLVMRGGKHRQIQCHSLVALIKHPSHGWGLWDTGYAPRMLAATERWPFNLYRRATPMFVRHDLTVATQLARFQLDPTDIHWVVLSHMHADHLAGLRDFPHAQVYLSRSAYESVRGLQGIAAVRRAFIPSLMPSNLDKHLNLIDQWDGPEIPELGPSHDLFGDRSLLIVQLPGHGRGQIGMLLQTEQRRILLAADAAWVSQSIRENRLPSPLTYFFIDNKRDLRNSLASLHRFAQAHPDVTLIPTHCPEAYAREVKHD